MMQGRSPTYTCIDSAPNSPPLQAATEDYLTLPTGIFRNNPRPREEGRTDGGKTGKERTGNPSLGTKSTGLGKTNRRLPGPPTLRVTMSVSSLRLLGSKERSGVGSKRRKYT